MSYFDFTYDQPTKLVFGSDAVNQLGEQLQLCGAKKVLITMGGGSIKRSGLLDRVTACIDAAGISWVIVDGCRSNPEAQWIDSGAVFCRNEGCDFILAIGGGSVIDASKAISLLVANSGEHIWPYMTYEQNFEAPAIPLGVILTVSATGSECDASFVISNEETKDKLLFTENTCLPKFALCDPVQTYSVSPHQTACGVSDMLSHLLEQYLYNDDSCTVSDEMLLGIMRAVVKWGPIAVKEPENYDARANLMLSSTLAMNGLIGVGHDQNWVSHMIEHGISAIWPQVAHGAGMACIMSAYIDHIAVEGREKISHFAHSVFGKDNASEAMRDFTKELGLATNLTGLLGREPTDAELEMIVARSLPWGTMEAGGYLAFDADSALKLLKAIK